MASVDLDQLDRSLIELLSIDARVSNRGIASQLGVTEGTVRGRLKRLQQENLIRFTAVTDLTLSEAPLLAFVYISADAARLKSVAADIAELPYINAVLTMLGRYNILALGRFPDMDQLMETASNRIVAMSGVRRTETSIAVNTFKYNPRVARITGPPRQGPADP